MAWGGKTAISHDQSGLVLGSKQKTSINSRNYYERKNGKKSLHYTTVKNILLIPLEYPSLLFPKRTQKTSKDK